MTDGNLEMFIFFWQSEGNLFDFCATGVEILRFESSLLKVSMPLAIIPIIRLTIQQQQLDQGRDGKEFRQTEVVAFRIHPSSRVER